MADKKKPKKRYSYIQSAKYPNQTCIGINEGKYAGVIYKYGKVTFPEEIMDEKDGKLTMQFEFDILENNGLPRDVFGDEFFNYIGDILVELIDEQNNRKDDTLSSDLERGLL